MKLDYVKQITTITDVKILQNEIIEIVCFDFKIGFDKIVYSSNGSRNEHDTYARQLLCYFLYVYCKLKAPNIAHIVDRDRNSVHNAILYVDSITEMSDAERYYIKLSIENKIRKYLSIGLVENKISKESELKYKVIQFLNARHSFFSRKFASKQQRSNAESNKRLIRDLINEVKQMQL